MSDWMVTHADYAQWLAAAAWQAGGELRIDDTTMMEIGPHPGIKSYYDDRTMQHVIGVVPAPPPRKPYIEPGDFREVKDVRALAKPVDRLSPP